jgi:hypothetical protein
MAKQSKAKTSAQQTDGAFLLKLVLYLMLGFQWFRLVNDNLTKQVPIPIGLVVGILFAQHEIFKIDRKLEYAVLLVSMLIGFWSQVGVYLYVLK